MRWLATALALGVATAVGLAACGDSSTEADDRSEAESRRQVEATASRFAAAVERKDPRAFCRLLAPSAVERLGGGRSNGKKECLVVWGPKRNPFFKAEHPNLALEGVGELDAFSATARLANGGRLVLVRERGGWYVNLAPEKE